MFSKGQFGIAVTAILVACAIDVVAQTSSQRTDRRASLSGAWTLDPSLSDVPGRPGSAAGRGEGQEPPRGGGGGRGMPGGGIPGDGGMGGRGMPGGRGGGAPNETEIKRVRTLTEALMTAPVNLVLTVGDGQVTFTEFDGRVQHFKTDNKKEKHYLATETVETKTKWDEDTLVREIALSSESKATESYSITESGHLQVSVRLENSRFGKPTIVKRVYQSVAAREPCP